MKFKFIYRAPEVNEPAGPGLTLSEIDNEDDNNPDGTLDDPDKGPDKAPEETDVEREARESAEAAKVKTPEPAKVEKIEKTDDKTPEADVDADPEEGEDDAEVEDFLADVDALRGDTVEVDYGTVDPLSPEGVVLRERAVEDAAVAAFEDHLETKYPKAYGFFAHLMAGGTEEDFFGKATNLDTLPTEEEIEASVEKSKEIVMRDLIAKGNSEKHASLIIKNAIEDNELEELAKTSLASRKAAQQADLDAIKLQNDNMQAERTNAIAKLSTVVDSVVSTGKIGNITIPEPDRKPFAKMLKENIKYDNGKFIMTTELTDENLTQLLGKEYYSYKKGDLGKLVTAAAKTENVRRLRKTLETQKVPGSKGEKKPEIVAMGDIEAD